MSPPFLSSNWSGQMWEVTSGHLQYASSIQEFSPISLHHLSCEILVGSLPCPSYKTEKISHLGVPFCPR